MQDSRLAKKWLLFNMLWKVTFMASDDSPTALWEVIPKYEISKQAKILIINNLNLPKFL